MNICSDSWLCDVKLIDFHFKYQKALALSASPQFVLQVFDVLTSCGSIFLILYFRLLMLKQMYLLATLVNRIVAPHHLYHIISFCGKSGPSSSCKGHV